MNEGKLDPRLRFVREQDAADRTECAASLSICAGQSHPSAIDVLVRCRKEDPAQSKDVVVQRLRELGVLVHIAIDGRDVVADCSTGIDQLDALVREDQVELIEAGRTFDPDLDLSGAEVQVRPLQTVPPTVRGTGVLVGIVDTGIDLSHDDFRDANGHSRILFLWDQRGPAAPGGRVPYGREYTRAELDEMLRATPAPDLLKQCDTHGHGTHVAGIAAGNGRKSGGKYIGIAPDAELVVAIHRENEDTRLESTSIAAGCAYVAERARDLKRPIAINFSNGGNAGGHSGETALESALDNLARERGVVVVKSAGNEQSWQTHASGRAAEGQTVTRKFESSGNNKQQDIIEVWFDARDRILIAATAPGAPPPAQTDFAAPGRTLTLETHAGNSVRIDMESVDSGGTGDVRACVFIGRGTAERIQPGTWTLHFTGERIADGVFHAWIERVIRANEGIEQTRFTTADRDPTCMITTPGTARRIITVGSYVTRSAEGSPTGNLSSFSSRGPTRYGLRKPDLSAPGERIVAPLSSVSTKFPAHAPGYALLGGTSMAAPHVTGAAALLLQINPAFNCEQVKQLLVRAARTAGTAPGAPDDSWGAGRLRIGRAVELARAARFPVITNVAVNGTTIEWDTDIPTTGAVRFNPHQRRLLLGVATGSRASLKLATHHAIDLSGLPPAKYFCEVIAFTAAPDEWQTPDDKGGDHYAVAV